MKIDSCLTKLGRTNRWIIKWFVVISLAKSVASVFAMLAFQFTARMPSNYHCNIPPNVSMKEFIPQEWKDGKLVYSSCNQFSNFTNSSIIPCQNGYNYSLEYFKNSIVTEWDLVCGREYLNTVATSSFFVMSFFGAIINCNLADQYGRKVVFLVAFGLLHIIQFMQAFVTNIYFHIILKLFAGIFQQGTMITGFTLSIEFFPLKDRSMACLVDTFSWTFGCIFLVTIVYFFRDWRCYFIITTIVMLPFTIIYCYLPESIRWLMSNNKNEEAKVLLKKAAKYTHPPLLETTFDNLNIEDDIERYEPYNITTIFHDKMLLRFQIINTFIWFITAMTFYGIQVKVVTIGNPFINFFLVTLAEVPANISAFPLANKFGRKVIIGIASFLVSLTIILGYNLFLFIENLWPATIIFLLGKMLNTVVFNLIFMHTSEIFPTTLRSTAVGMSSSSARLGATVGASLFLLPSSYECISFIILSVTCFIASILVFILPETYKKKLPTTIEEIRSWVEDKPCFSLR